jgi:branched-chain amino acid transport system permease protein
MLAISGAAEFSGWLAGDVSYGTRRKIELARGLITGPDILLLDEPTSGVSRDHVDVIKRLILREANRGCAVLIVDHDLDVIEEICDRVVVLDAGKKIYDGPVRAAFEDPTVQLAYVGS